MSGFLLDLLGLHGFTNIHYMSPLYFLPVCFGEFSPTCSAKALQIALQRFGIAWQFRPQTAWKKFDEKELEIVLYNTLHVEK